MARVKITQTRPTIGTEQNMEDALCVPGLCEIGQSVVREPTDTVFGVACTVRHLITVEEID